VAPRGGWLFAMPQHTGTHTVVDFLNRQNQTLGMWRCSHHHDIFRGTLPVPNTVFTLLFVANPYRRVLAHAAHCGVVPSAATSSAPSSEEQIRQFSKFVSRLTMWNVNQRAACYHRCYAYDLRRHGFMWNQFRFLREQPTEQILVGRTAQLSEHMRQALVVMGYRHIEGALSERLSFIDSRTATALLKGRTQAEREREHREQNKSIIDQNTAWYANRSTARRVVQLFHEDFHFFDFSTDVAQMNRIERHGGQAPLLAVVSRSELQRAKGTSKGSLSAYRSRLYD